MGTGTLDFFLSLLSFMQLNKELMVEDGQPSYLAWDCLHLPLAQLDTQCVSGLLDPKEGAFSINYKDGK